MLTVIGYGYPILILALGLTTLTFLIKWCDSR
jgi:hypothetical protein